MIISLSFCDLTLKGSGQGGVKLKAGEECLVSLSSAEKISAQDNISYNNSKANQLYHGGTMASSLKVRFLFRAF